MKTYLVMLPIDGFAVVQVNAHNGDNAIEEAFKNVHRDDIEQWDAFEHIVKGNIIFAPVNSIEVEEVK